MRRELRRPYPSLDAYSFIGDGHTSALVSASGSIDWCCMPRMDSASVFGRLLDWERGGYVSLAPAYDDWEVRRRYLPETLVLESTFETGEGRIRLLDCVALRRGGREEPHRQVIRVVEGVEGRVQIRLVAAPRHEYGAVKPWLRTHDGGNVVSGVGGSAGLLFTGDIPFSLENGEIRSDFELAAGERRRMGIQWHPPQRFEWGIPEPAGPDELEERLDQTIELWREWSSRLLDDEDLELARHSARVLKAMINPPTGAMVAAPTTSLPETIGGVRNWDYRYSWIRDSIFAVRALTRLGAFAEADGFRRFVQRTSAGDADEVQLVYGVDGRLRLPEYVLELEGYRGSRPVRIGNAAHQQLQLDTYGYLLELAWEWYQRADQPDPVYWESILEIADLVERIWREKDYGIWEIRTEPRHYVHSKVMCWAGLDHAIRLNELTGLDAPVDRWRKTRDAIRDRVMDEGVVDGAFVQAFGMDAADAALLMLPLVDFVPADDPRMVCTTDRIMEELSVGDSRLIKRYRSDDGLQGEEGAFLTCCFWLAEVLQMQGRTDEAREVFDAAVGTAGETGLFSEEFDPREHGMLGNYPQALSHLAHIEAALELRAVRQGQKKQFEGEPSG